MNVKKRDGRIVPFDSSKIERAILAAFKQVDGEITEYAQAKAENIAAYIEGYFEDVEETPEIEEIQDLVEKGLMATKRKDVAKTYILYREERTKIRNKNSKLMQNIKEKLEASNVQNQNANMDERSFGGRMGEARSEFMKDYALNYLVSPMARENHLNNEIYIHDLDAYAVGMHNCLTVPFDKLLAEGFNTRQTDVRPARSINTAFQLVAVLFQLQSLQQFGGVSASHLDWTMVPYIQMSYAKHLKDGVEHIGFNYFSADVREKILEAIPNKVRMIDYKKENVNGLELANKFDFSTDAPFWSAFPKIAKYAIDMTKKELMQAVQGMYHNLNTLQSRSGNQLPFTSINYGTCTLLEGRMVTKALLEGSIEGVGKVRKTPIFPCGIFQCMKGVNRKPGDPNYDLFKLALKSTAQRLYPNYVNVDWSVNAGFDINDPKTYVSTMGCRTYNGSDINADEGVNPQTKDGRGNICPVTIVMPTLAMKAVEKHPGSLELIPGTGLLTAGKNNREQVVETFMKLLDTKIHEAKDMLLERYQWIISQSPESAKFMYENNIMLGYDGKTVESAMKHGTLVIGQIGLAETLQILIGKDHTTEKGMELAKRIEQLFKDRCAEFKKELHLNIGVYYTPKLFGLGVA